MASAVGPFRGRNQWNDDFDEGGHRGGMHDIALKRMNRSHLSLCFHQAMIKRRQKDVVHVTRGPSGRRTSQHVQRLLLDMDMDMDMDMESWFDIPKHWRGVT